MRLSSISRYSFAAIALPLALCVLNCGSNASQPTGTTASGSAGSASDANSASDGNSASDSNSAAGGNVITVGGHALDVSHAVYQVGPVTGDANSIQTLIYMGGSADLCAQVQGRKYVSGTDLVTINATTPKPALAAVTYNVLLASQSGFVGGPANTILVDASYYDASGSDTLHATGSDATNSGAATAGQVVITKVATDNGPISGTFAWTMGPQGDKNAGSFEATFCATTPNPTASGTPTPSASPAATSAQP